MTSPVGVGDVIGGRYLVEGVLGEGGMGVVVAARHVDLDERVAIKFILPEFAGNDEVVGRFVREGRLAARIKSEHVTRIRDAGRLPSGAPYVVMEYLNGADLGEILRERGPLAIEEAVLYTLHACHALAEAHALGIVHRDIKPGNLFLTRGADGARCVKLLDFGIAKLTRSTDDWLTRTGELLGSAAHISPEQLASARDVDARTDIWSLGVILYEMLTARRPFEAVDLPRLVLTIANDTPERPRTHRGDLPVDLERVILRCMSKDRDARFADVGALSAALLPFGPPHAAHLVDRIAKISVAGAASEDPSRRSPEERAGIPVTRVERVAAAAQRAKEELPPMAHDTIVDPPVDERPPPTEPSRSARLVAAGALGSLLLIGAGFGLGRLGGPPPEPSRPVAIPDALASRPAPQASSADLAPAPSSPAAVAPERPASVVVPPVASAVPVRPAVPAARPSAPPRAERPAPRFDPDDIH